MDNNKQSEIELKFEESQNYSVFVTSPKKARTGLYLTAANYSVTTNMFWVLN